MEPDEAKVTHINKCLTLLKEQINWPMMNTCSKLPKEKVNAIFDAKYLELFRLLQKDNDEYFEKATEKYIYL